MGDGPPRVVLVMPPGDVVVLAPVPGATFAGPLTDPWPDRLESPGMLLRFRETDGLDVAIYLHGETQVDVHRWKDGTYRAAPIGEQA